jgi:hypothetical protein
MMSCLQADIACMANQERQGTFVISQIEYLAIISPRTHVEGIADVKNVIRPKRCFIYSLYAIPFGNQRSISRLVFVTE